MLYTMFCQVALILSSENKRVEACSVILSLTFLDKIGRDIL